GGEGRDERLVGRAQAGGPRRGDGDVGGGEVGRVGQERQVSGGGRPRGGVGPRQVGVGVGVQGGFRIGGLLRVAAEQFRQAVERPRQVLEGHLLGGPPLVGRPGQRQPVGAGPLGDEVLGGAGRQRQALDDGLPRV